MPNVHVYFAIENLAMSNSQRTQLHNVLKSLGIAPNHPNASHRPHYRMRPDGEAIIYEAEFDSADLTVTAFRHRLADIFNVNVNQITASSNTNAYGALHTFTHNATAYFRILAFGYSAGWPTRSESAQAARLFLHDFRDDWEPNTEPVEVP